MAERKPTGMTLEAHRRFAAVLEEIDILAHRPPVSDKADAIQGQLGADEIKLRSEMDECARNDFPELEPSREGAEVYYPHEERPAPDACSVEHALVAVREHIVTLSAADPASRAVALSQKLLKTLQRLQAEEEKTQAMPMRPQQ